MRCSRALRAEVGNEDARDLPNTPNERSRRQGYAAGWSLSKLSATNEGHLARTHERTDNREDVAQQSRDLATV